MPGIRLNGRAYGGTATVASADHLMVQDGSGNETNAQNLVSNILGDFGTVETSTSASKAYAVGDYLVLNGNLYKVTSAIAADGAITVGTNVVKTTVSDQIGNDVIYLKNKTVSATTGDIATISDSRITPDHVLVSTEWGNPSAITTDVSWSTETAGQLVLNGTCTSATTVNVVLVK